MRRTKHRRWFHTERVIRNRQRAYRRETPSWELIGWPRHLEDGRLADENAYFGCRRPRCYICHFDKLIGDQRTREKRLWKREIEDD